MGGHSLARVLVMVAQRFLDTGAVAAFHGIKNGFVASVHFVGLKRPAPVFIQKKFGYPLTGSTGKLTDERVVATGEKALMKSVVQCGDFFHGSAFFCVARHVVDQLFHDIEIFFGKKMRRSGDRSALKNAAGEIAVFYFLGGKRGDKLPFLGDGNKKACLRKVLQRFSHGSPAYFKASREIDLVDLVARLVFAFENTCFDVLGYLVAICLFMNAFHRLLSIQNISVSHKVEGCCHSRVIAALCAHKPGDILLRIIQVVNVRWFNATAWYGLFLARILRDAGHDVRVLGLGGTDSFAKAEEWGLDPIDCPLNSSNPLRIAEAYGKIRRLVREFSPHIVNCHRGEGFVLWALLKEASAENPFALIRTRGDQRPPRGGFANRYLHADAADAVIATSSSIAENVRSILHVPPAKVHTIYGGVDTAKFYPDPESRAQMRASMGLGDCHTAIGLVGRFDAVKGQKELIASFARLRKMLGEKAAGTRLVLAGFATSSTSVEAVKGWAEEAGIGDAVIYPGRCDDARALMNALDLGVVASLGSETIARVALEIMACGVPLIGTRVGVMPDLLTDDALVPPGDEAAMANALCRLISEAAYGAELRSVQKKRMTTLSGKDFYEQTMNVYEGAYTARR